MTICWTDCVFNHSEQPRPDAFVTSHTRRNVDTVTLLAWIGALAAVVAVILAAVQHRKNGWIVTADCAGFNTYRSGGRQINRPAIEIAVRNEGRTPVSVSALIAKFATSHAPPIVLTLEPDWLLTPWSRTGY